MGCHTWTNVLYTDDISHYREKIIEELINDIKLYEDGTYKRKLGYKWAKQMLKRLKLNKLSSTQFKRLVSIYSYFIDDNMLIFHKGKLYKGINFDVGFRVRDYPMRKLKIYADFEKFINHYKNKKPKQINYIDNNASELVQEFFNTHKNSYIWFG